MLLAKLQALVLYGSHARGDADTYSDRDLCAFVDDMTLDEIIDLREILSRMTHEHSSSISIYTMAAVHEMQRYGSLFLWHIKLEGKIVIDRAGSVTDLLRDMPTFIHYDKELNVFDHILDDMLQANTSEYSHEFDLHLLHTIVRNCSILICYYYGEPTFGRLSAYLAAKAFHPEMAIDQVHFDLLTRAHLSYLRGAAYSENSLPQNRLVDLARRTAQVVRLTRAITES